MQISIDLQDPSSVGTCGDQWVGAEWVGDQYDTMMLCPDQCDAFMTAGKLTLAVGFPPCE